MRTNSCLRDANRTYDTEISHFGGSSNIQRFSTRRKINLLLKLAFEIVKQFIEVSLTNILNFFCR